MQLLLAIRLLAGLAGLVAAQSDPRNPTSPIKATMTYYGSIDHQSGNCQTNTVACGFYTTGQYDYYAAISQYYYGCGSHQGACQGCSKCWLVTPYNDSSSQPLHGANSIVVKINNLCPVEGNPLCAQSGPNDANQYGGKVNIDTCYDSGATQALFGTSGVGLAVGYAKEVDCSLWGKPYTGPPIPDPGSSGSGSGSGSASPTCSGGVPAQTMYGQCGGQSYTGPTCCPSGTTCQVQNTYYSQCLPPSSKMRRAIN